MILYPFQTLVDSGINDILIITNPEDEFIFKKLFADFADDSTKISFKVQEKPNGIAEAFILSEGWLNNEGCVLILGDNIFISNNLSNDLKQAKDDNYGATLFAYQVDDPNRYGVVEFSNDKVISIEEKPKNPKSNWAVTGLYVYDKSVAKKSKKLIPSDRGELEITDLNLMYLKEDNLNINLLDKDSYWLDAGTYDSLLDAGNLIKKLKL